MKFKELTTKSEGELKTMLEELKNELHDMQVKVRLGQIKTTHKIRVAKKDIARILTHLHTFK